MNNSLTRKSNRLKNYDYSKNGAYFVTICAKDHAEIFGRIVSVGAATCRPHDPHPPYNPPPHVELSPYGEIIETSIKNIHLIYQHVDVETYVVMPNHVHLIITINERSGDNLPPANDDNLTREGESCGRQIAATTVSVIVGNLKKYVSSKIGFSPWQKSFHDHIIRNTEDYARIAEYIENNPACWTEDCYYGL